MSFWKDNIDLKALFKLDPSVIFSIVHSDVFTGIGHFS